MGVSDGQYAPERVELKGYLAEFRDALEEEIRDIEKNGQSITSLAGGRRIGNRGLEFWYRFSVEYAPSIPADTPATLLIGRDRFDVTVISFEENSITISSTVQLPDHIGRAQLENGATELMRRLIKRIEENATKKNPAGEHMLDCKDGVYPAKQIRSHDNLVFDPVYNEELKRAIKTALEYDITYIWGPPGTGKTMVIGRIAGELFQRGRSVLVVSHTNTAVDGAIEKTDEEYSKRHTTDAADYPILRLGTPSRLLPERVLLKTHVTKLGEKLVEKKQKLENEQAKKNAEIGRMLDLLKKDTWVKGNKLGQIKETLYNIANLEKQESDIKQRIESINTELQLIKENCPKYREYCALAKDYSILEKEYRSACDRLSEAETIIEESPRCIQEALDEVKKHDIYTALREKEETHMSIQFLNKEISKAISNIERLSSEKNQIDVRRNEATQKIAKYELKSSFAKVFSGKGAINEARSCMQESEIRLQQIESELQRTLELEQRYKDEINELSILKEQIKAVKPSNTVSYWEGEADTLQKKNKKAKEEREALLLSKSRLEDRLPKLEAQCNAAKVPFDSFKELDKDRQTAEGGLKRIKDTIMRAHSRCQQQLSEEYSQCSAFSDIAKGGSNKELFDILCTQLNMVRNEVKGCNPEELQKHIAQLEKELNSVSKQMDEIREKLLELEKQAVMKASIIGCTLAKSYLSDVLRQRTFDTVILDEASMASIPALWCAGYLAVNCFVIVGDFLQLPPIVLASTPMARKWLGKDIFYHSGMQAKAKGTNEIPVNFVMLDRQYRMESDIADISNMYYGQYKRLRSDDIATCRIEGRQNFYKWCSEKENAPHVHLIDTESLHAWVTGVRRPKGHSRLNCFSAAVDVDLAFSLLKNKLLALDPNTAKPVTESSILIVAPYKPHVKRLSKLIELEYRNRGFKEDLNYIRAGTIHSFQGSEADIVIFDLVIDEPHWKANLFMTESGINDDLRKMFNVAITRAKYQLFIVGNFAYCQKHAKNNALSDLLNKLILKNRLEKIDAKQLFPNITFSRQTDVLCTNIHAYKHILCREASFDAYFMEDIRSFKQRLIIYSPFITESRLCCLLPHFADAVSAGKQIIVVTKTVSERNKGEVGSYQKCEEELRSIGVSVLHKKGMHEKLIFVDSEALWIGSLNALSYTGLTGEIMYRLEDATQTKEHEDIYYIESICDAVDHSYEQKCPICNNEMVIRDCSDGGIYWKCINCDYSRNYLQQYPKDGIMRCKCGAEYVFSMKKEPRWVCSKDPHHYQTIHRSDLLLNKMAALIPTKADRERVNAYFDSHKGE